uniref:Uncharacterized protein n=1 Tax=Arundo donax TaxID=35708 RepID=A0A0A8XVI0_ARUDO
MPAGESVATDGGRITASRPATTTNHRIHIRSTGARIVTTRTDSIPQTGRRTATDHSPQLQSRIPPPQQRRRSRASPTSTGQEEGEQPLLCLYPTQSNPNAQ